jgi:acyl-coenzyme A thioesterase PaaI-like protein
VHGGILMALADYTLCLGANGGESESVVTVSCSNEFTAPAFQGDLIEGRAQVIKRGGSMVFVRCELMVDESVVLMSSAVIKRLRK